MSVHEERPTLDGGHSHSGFCERCWGDAYMRSLDDTSKTQTEHYSVILDERMAAFAAAEKQTVGEAVQVRSAVSSPTPDPEDR